MQTQRNEEIRQVVRDTYATVAEGGTNSCCSTSSPTSCCGAETAPTPEETSVAIGYSQHDVATVPDGANMGLGCGNPQAIAALLPGETVLDLGSGGGLDCFLAARAVGDEGRAIGVDMTPEMVQKARGLAAEIGAGNVEFRLGQIEALPVADDAVDVIMSNCVINLSPEKPRVFEEAFRVLKPGGRLALADIVATAPLPDEVRADLALHAGCIAGAVTIDEVKAALTQAGFGQILITPAHESGKASRNPFPDDRVVDFVVSATIEAVKP